MAKRKATANVASMGFRSRAVVLGILLAATGASVGVSPEPALPTPAAPVPAAPATSLTPTPAAPGTAAAAPPEVVVEGPDPQFVAPTRRDRIGRIWAPVYINGRGPFRLVLDTGASHSVITAGVAEALGIQPQQRAALLRGVTGSATVAAVRIDSLRVGDLMMNSTSLPIVPDVFGGAQGVLGPEGLADKRILIDFVGDQIIIARSKGERAPPGFLTVPVQLSAPRLLVVDARVGGIRTQAIIDTGGQGTLGNVALREALARKPPAGNVPRDEVVGATDDVQLGDRMLTPVIDLGPVQVRNAHVTYGDMYIFEHWKLNRHPAMLIGMDVIGVFDTLIIDYRRHELQVRMR
jgi:Aspartyl protease